ESEERSRARRGGAHGGSFRGGGTFLQKAAVAFPRELYHPKGMPVQPAPGSVAGFCRGWSDGMDDKPRAVRPGSSSRRTADVMGYVEGREQCGWRSERDLTACRAFHSFHSSHARFSE